jgi:hypothetical protein
MVLAAAFFIPFASISAEPLSPATLKLRPQPKPLFQKAEVVVDWQEVLDDCSETQLCVQGGLLSSGGKTATGVKLRVEIGNTALAKPRVTKMIPLDEPTMNPGDRQEFYFTLDRKTPYKDYKGKPKVMEVGKYNFRIIPLWAGKKESQKP